MVTKRTTTRKKAAPKAKAAAKPVAPATAKPKTRVQVGWHKGRPVYSDGE